MSEQTPYSCRICYEDPGNLVDADDTNKYKSLREQS